MLFLLLGPWRFAAGADSSTVTPPSQVIMSKAIVVDQGVEVDWLPAQEGSYPIGGYDIQKSSQGGDYVQIDSVDGSSQSYIDTTGQVGDAYKVIAEDNQTPANTSTPSDPITATQATPGDAVAVAPPTSVPDPASASIPTVPQSSAPTTAPSVVVPTTDTPQQVSTLVKGVQQFTTSLDTALNVNDPAKTVNSIHAVQGYNRQMLMTLPDLSAPQRQSLAATCKQQRSVLQPDVFLLPEDNLIDGLLALASCDAVQGAQ